MIASDLDACNDANEPSGNAPSATSWEPEEVLNFCHRWSPLISTGICDDEEDCVGVLDDL